MHSGFSTAGQSVHLNVIKDSFLWVTNLGLTKSHFWKTRALEKGPPKWKLGADIVKMLSELKLSQNGWLKGYDEKHNWTHKSCLWEHPYAKALILPHNINLMHQETNIVKSIISMCFDITGFSKDNVNARKDLAALCNHPSLEQKRNVKGNLKRPWAPYCLKLIERKEILRWLKKLKFLDRYASNIKRAANVSTGKLNELKSHDDHIIIERLMQKLEKEITVLVCKMEKIFSPGWFSAMQHLLVHLPWEARVGGST
jgi:hypothetical protein